MRRNENVFAFSMNLASLEVLQLVMMLAHPNGIASYGLQNYHMTTGKIDLDLRPCAQDCIFPELVALGESAGNPGLER